MHLQENMNMLFFSESYNIMDDSERLDHQLSQLNISWRPIQSLQDHEEDDSKVQLSKYRVKINCCYKWHRAQAQTPNPKPLKITHSMNRNETPGL
jgi:uncharacterized protein YjcR